MNRSSRSAAETTAVASPADWQPGQQRGTPAPHPIHRRRWQWHTEGQATRLRGFEESVRGRLVLPEPRCVDQVRTPSSTCRVSPPYQNTRCEALLFFSAGLRLTFWPGGIW